MNFNMTLGQAAWRLFYCVDILNARKTLAASCICWMVPFVTCEWGEGLV